MKKIQRGVRIMALIALFVTGFALLAQESTEEATDASTEVTPEVTVEATSAPTIDEVAGGSASIVGSGIVNPAIQALISSSDSILTYDVTTTGTDIGFEQFCSGSADMTTSVRPINVEEDALCRENGISYLELLIGYDVMVFIGNPQDDFLTCLTSNNINTLFAPSSEGSISNWSEITLPSETSEVTATATPQAEATPEATAEMTEEAVALPDITLLLPQDNTITYATLDGITTGFGLRSDAVSLDAASIVETVATTSGAIGVVPLGVAQAAENISILNVDFTGDAVGCETPSIETVEAETYRASTPMYLYVKQVSQETLAFFLNHITDISSAPALEAAGYLAPSNEAIELNRSIVSGEAPARAITAEEVTYEIPPNLTGTVTLVGASSGFRIADTATSRLASTQQQLVLNTDFNGQAAGIEDFCNGEANILFVNGDPFNVCGGAVEYEAFELGEQAVVMIANSSESYANCLTRDQIITIWSSASADTVTTWSDVAESFPETNLILVGISSGNILTDILLAPSGGGAPLPVRVDVAETNNDHNYRAAAVGNVPGALAYMSWIDYQDVVDNGQENIQLVAVDSGSGCIVPSEGTIHDGSYPLTRRTSMLVKTSSLATVPVQSLVWTIYSDATYPVLESLDFVVTIPSDDLPQFRTDLLALFEEVEAQVAAEVTPEVTAEVTSEATPEATEATSGE